MADDHFKVGQSVKVDGKGEAIVKEKVFRGFGTFYLVHFNDVDFEVELEPQRLTPVTPPRPNVQTTQTGQHSTVSSRFVPSSELDINQFIEEQTNKNTLQKTMYDLKILNEYFQQPNVNENRSIQNIPANELSVLLCRFFMSVRKSNGDEYEPSSLRGLISSYDRQLRRYNYGEYIATSPVFAQVREVLKSKQKKLKRDGKGNLPNKSEAISDHEINILWEKKQFGSETPDAILHTLWFYNTVHFGLRGRHEHREMCWGDVTLKTNTDGHEYLEFCERQSKTRTGNDPRNVRDVKPKLWANLDNPERCPVNIYKIYARKRPTGYSQPNHPFYIASTTKHSPSPNETWFKRNPIGTNKLGSMMSTMVHNSEISTDKRLTNHSARKYLVQKLCDSNIPPTQIAQISGHRNLSSINNYSSINTDQHQNISRLLHQNSIDLVSNNAHMPVMPRSIMSRPSTATTHTITQPPSLQCSSTNAFRHESAQTTNVTGGLQSVISAPIHGGTFHINIYQNTQNVSPQEPKRKRIRIIESDSD